MMNGFDCCQQGDARIEQFTLIYGFGNWTKNRLSGNLASHWLRDDDRGQVYEMPTFRPWRSPSNAGEGVGDNASSESAREGYSGFSLFGSQCLHWIEAGGAPGGEKTCEGGYCQ
jgi:hypothetical protein